jgi:hypothetical protein
MVDLNGDNLLDKVFIDRVDVWYQPNVAGKNMFGNKVKILNGTLFFAVCTSLIQIYQWVNFFDIKKLVGLILQA